MKEQNEKQNYRKQESKLSVTSHHILTVVGIVLCIILIPMLIINCTLIIKSFMNKEKVPDMGGIFPMLVLTDSMYPDIKSGDLIFCRTADAETVEVGDVISFFDPTSSGNAVVTHEVIEIIPNEDGTLSYRTKGINNNIEDRELVPEDNLIGRYLGLRIPWGGSIALFMQTTYGLIVFVFLPFVLLVVFDLIRRRRNEKRQKDDVAALMAELEALKASNADVSDAPVAESCLPAADDSDSHDDAILPSEATSGDGIKLAGTQPKKPTHKPNFPGKREE